MTWSLTWTDDMADTADKIVMWALTWADDMVSGRQEQFVVSIALPYVRGWFLAERAQCNNKVTCIPGYSGKTAFHRELTKGHGSGSDIDESHWI